jgi:hypothetical protein
MPTRRKKFLSLACLSLGCASFLGCGTSSADLRPVVEFSRVPEAADGSPERLEAIEGRVKGARPGHRIVLFSLSGMWWVQPMFEQPFTAIQKDSTWKSETHPGLAYAALLVDDRYRPPLTVNSLPEIGGPVLAVTTVRGTAPKSPPKTIQFSGYQWDLPPNAPETGGNVWTDDRGLLHLRATKQGDQWSTGIIKLSRSLGYGSYRFVVHDISHLEPAAVFAMYTFDYQGPSREMDIEVSRWGSQEDKNAQFVIQPYVVPANTVRFNAPGGTVTHWMDWEPGRVSFKTSRGLGPAKGSNIVAEHVFTSGVPSAGNERIHLNLWVYGNRRNPVQQEFEVIVEKFEFLP